MESIDKLCCCCGQEESFNNCLICGKPLIYSGKTVMRRCAVCGEEKPSDAVCEDGHFVCDECHNKDGAAVRARLLNIDEKDPIKIFLDVVKLPSVHMHGPEHHCIVPCVLLTAYKNNGGDIDLRECLDEAWKRGKKLSGGSCGFLGVCGAAAGAGIYASILSEATPLTAEVWDVPQRMTMRFLETLVETGGPRCCKRTGRQSIETAVEFTKERFGVDMPVSRPRCEFFPKNKECLHERCPYFPTGSIKTGEA